MTYKSLSEPLLKFDRNLRVGGSFRGAAALGIRRAGRSGLWVSARRASGE